MHENNGYMPDQSPDVKTDGGIRRKKSYPLHMHISIVYILLTVLLLSIISIFNYREAQKNLFFTTQQVFMQINSEIKTRISHLQYVSTEAITYLYRVHSIESTNSTDKARSISLIGAILQLHPELSSISIGYSNGDFIRFRRVLYRDEQDSDSKLQEIWYIVRNYVSPQESQSFTYLNKNMDILDQREIPHDGYDPRDREWYSQAMATDKAISTKPYFLISSQSLGKSVAQRNKNKDMVISVAFPLKRLDHFIDSIKPVSSNLLIFDNNEDVLYYSEVDVAVKDTPAGETGIYKLSELEYPLSDAIREKINASLFDTPFTVKVDGKDFIFTVTKLMDTSVGGMDYYVAISSLKSDVLPNLTDFIKWQALFTLLAFLIAVPVSWFFSKQLSKGLIMLSAVANDATNFSFSLEQPLSSTVQEFNELSLSMYRTNRTLKRFLEINAAISSERDYSKLLDTILSETMGTVDAVVGILYLMSNTEKQLIPGAANCICAKNSGKSMKTDNTKFFHSLAPIEITDNIMNTAQHILKAVKEIPHIGQIDRDDWPTGYMRDIFDDQQMQLISVPLSKNGKVTGVLCLYRRGRHEQPNRDMLSFVSQLSGGAAVAIENHLLLDEQKKLFDAFVQLLAGAIDSKSHYTGGHCQRVPVIANMLAAAVDKVDNGPLADFHISENGWEAIRLASWLHDCGKIVTPEHVVDKATKLETVYNRIHEIRMRFEVMKRDAEIKYYRSLPEKEKEKTAEKTLQEELKRLDDDFEFLANCNIGDKPVTKEDLQRLEEISHYTWQRTISDRLGISEAERKRKEATPEYALPAEERLLADKPEHLIEMEDSAWAVINKQMGFKFEPPKYKYNLGEITNLLIPAGTLTNEERYLINDHVVQTIIMLSHLPFPEKYGDIVEIAGNHHERVDAKGYPKGIGKDQMSVEARMIAIADVFEALTAADRPYKKAKKLSDALGIMSHMAKNGHLDPDLFNIFLSSGVYRQYAELYLQSFQVDDVNENDLLV